MGTRVSAGRLLAMPPFPDKCSAIFEWDSGAACVTALLASVAFSLEARAAALLAAVPGSLGRPVTPIKSALQ